MNLSTIIYYFFVFIAGASALGLLFIKNIFKGALLLLTCLLSVAALYVFSSAEFVAVAQILIYAGGIIIVIIFGVMLTTKSRGTALSVTNKHIFPGVLVSGALLFLLIEFIPRFLLHVENGKIEGNGIEKTGINFLNEYALPFELAGLLLLVALIGAAITASPQVNGKKS